MGETIGLLKVIIVQGKQLVIRDFRTSDPYVVVKLGNQIAKTKVINSCLNPIWNEELTFSVVEPPGILNLLRIILRVCRIAKLYQSPGFEEVFDKDRFKSDDKMGYAHLNLQHIASAARLKQVLKASDGETKIRTIIPGKDNCLVRDSVITCVDGEVLQDVMLRLSEVESGEIELKLKWVDHHPSRPAPSK